MHIISVYISLCLCAYHLCLYQSVSMCISSLVYINQCLCAYHLCLHQSVSTCISSLFISVCVYVHIMSIYISLSTCISSLSTSVCVYMHIISVYICKALQLQTEKLNVAYLSVMRENCLHFVFNYGILFRFVIFTYFMSVYLFLSLTSCCLGKFHMKYLRQNEIFIGLRNNFVSLILNGQWLKIVSFF